MSPHDLGELLQAMPPSATMVLLGFALYGLWRVERRVLLVEQHMRTILRALQIPVATDEGTAD